MSTSRANGNGTPSRTILNHTAPGKLSCCFFATVCTGEEYACFARESEMPFPPFPGMVIDFGSLSTNTEFGERVQFFVDRATWCVKSSQMLVLLRDAIVFTEKQEATAIMKENGFSIVNVENDERWRTLSNCGDWATFEIMPSDELSRWELLEERLEDLEEAIANRNRGDARMLPDEPTILLRLDVRQLGLKPRTLKGCIRAVHPPPPKRSWEVSDQPVSVARLLELSPSQLLEQDNFGKDSLKDLGAALAKLGLSLREGAPS